MTSAPEAILAREAGMCYGAVAIVTNLAAGISPSRLSHDEVVAVMKSLEDPLSSALLEAVRRLPADRGCSCSVRSAG
jgi:5'-methylthioadenosine phosphorylase